jgi:hypothetical protein
MTTDYRALCAELNHWVVELAASHPNLSDSAITWINEVADRARAELAKPDQDDKTLKAIRETTPRYRMSVIVSTNDSAIDTRMNVIWQALDPSKEILESVSLPEQLPPLGSQ